jgi:hypothetical protein
MAALDPDNAFRIFPGNQPLAAQYRIHFGGADSDAGQNFAHE